MKEITTIATIEITNIVKVEDSELENVMEANNSPENQKEVANWIQEHLGLDKVDVRNMKMFVSDVVDNKTE